MARFYAVCDAGGVSAFPEHSRSPLSSAPLAPILLHSLRGDVMRTLPLEATFDVVQPGPGQLDLALLVESQIASSAGSSPSCFDTLRSANASCAPMLSMCSTR